MKIAVVVPTIRREQIVGFINMWAGHFTDHSILIVEDNLERTFSIPAPNVAHFCWSDIEKELGHRAWIIPRRTDCVRSFGYYKAFNAGADVILTLDDDCEPPPSAQFLLTHLENLTQPTAGDAWISTGAGVPPRGMPYVRTRRSNECVISHGLWDEHPDFDALTELAMLRFPAKFDSRNQVIPEGLYFPMCGMNLAFKRKMTPAMYFLLMGREWPFDRFGDIWCGIIVKKICDHLGFAIHSGEPKIIHRRASNIWTNLQKEAAGYPANEEFWAAVDSLVLTKLTVRDCYKEVADKLPLSGHYWDQLKLAMSIWADLFVADRETTDQGHAHQLAAGPLTAH